jgi:hypothetical protein
MATLMTLHVVNIAYEDIACHHATFGIVSRWNDGARERLTTAALARDEPGKTRLRPWAEYPQPGTRSNVVIHLPDSPTADAAPYRALTVTPTSPHIGAEIGGIDLTRPLPESQLVERKRAFVEERSNVPPRPGMRSTI